MHGDVIHWNLASVSSRGSFGQFRKILAVEPHFAPPALPQKFTQTDTPVSLLAGYHKTYTCRCKSILLKFTNGYYLRKSLKHGTYCNKNTIDKECFWYVIGSWNQRAFPRSAWSDTYLIWILCCKNVLLATQHLIYMIKVINKDTLVCVIKLLWVKLGNNFLCILFKF